MQNYNENPGSVRVDFFKPSGKWYCTEAVDMSEYYNQPLLGDAFSLALQKHFNKNLPQDRLSGMIAVCLQPYHTHSYPIMAVVGAVSKTVAFEKQ